MEKSWLVVIPLVLLMILLIPSLITPNENPATEATEQTETAEISSPTESTGETNPTQPTETTQPDETTLQTEDVGFIDGNASSGEVMAFQDRYTIVGSPMSETRRIAVVVDGVLGYHEILHEESNCSVDIQIGEGVHVNRLNGMFYIPESDTAVRKVGTTYQAGDEAVEYLMVNNDYVFTLNLELVDIMVQYIDMQYSNDLDSYFEKVLYYDLENVTSVRLEVSNYDSKEVRCFVIGPEGETEVFPSELPEELWGIYGYDPNQNIE